MGEAAGVTAALAAQMNLSPHQVPWDNIRSALDYQRKPQTEGVPQ
jgi:hypothetical protein